jgi:hypothetical protein
LKSWIKLRESEYIFVKFKNKGIIETLEMRRKLITLLMLLGLVAGCTNIGEAVSKNYDLNTFKAKTPVTEIFPIRDRILQKEKCEDTDGGINYREAGKVVLNGFFGKKVIKKDKCWSDGRRLQEYVCLNSDYKGDHTFDCSELGDNYICEDGACRSECVPQECSDLELECDTFDDGCGGTIECSCNDEEVCVDRDGGLDYHTKSSTNLGGIDQCISDSELREFYCGTNSRGLYSTDQVCEFGCFNGKCLQEDEELPVCDELINDHNNVEEERINIVFVGINYDNIEEFVEKATLFVNFDGEEIDYVDWAGEDQKVLGILGVEPYKSNIGSFNFWYVDEIEPAFLNNDEWEYSTILGEQCEFDNKFTVRLENFQKYPVGQAGIRVSTVSENDFRGASIRTLNHELGHALGGLKDVYPLTHHDSYENGFPNAALNLDQATEWWSDLIGFGCGEPGIIDCTENCVEEGVCETNEEYLVEVAYVASDLKNCFDENNSPIENCQSIFSRKGPRGGDGPDRNSVISKGVIAFRASTEQACQEGDYEDHCMYVDLETGEVMCNDQKLSRLDTCENLADYDVYGSTRIWHQDINHYPFKPSMQTIMGGNNYRLYGPVNERQLCERISEVTGNVEGICVEYEISSE